MKTPFNPATLIKKSVTKVSRPGTSRKPKAITDPPVGGISLTSAQPDRTGAVSNLSTDIGKVMPVKRPSVAPAVSYGTLLGYNKKK